MTATHKCRIEACTEQIPRSQLMCGPHWSEVPKPLRDEVNAAWRAYNRKGASLGPLLEAQDEAQRVVEGDEE